MVTDRLAAAPRIVPHASTTPQTPHTAPLLVRLMEGRETSHSTMASVQRRAPAVADPAAGGAVDGGRDIRTSIMSCHLRQRQQVKMMMYPIMHSTISGFLFCQIPLLRRRTVLHVSKLFFSPLVINFIFFHLVSSSASILPATTASSQGTNNSSFTTNTAPTETPEKKKGLFNLSGRGLGATIAIFAGVVMGGTGLMMLVMGFTGG